MPGNNILNGKRTDFEVAKKINELVEDTRRRPFQGLGKPEPLKGLLQGWWSRRITGEHRLVYRILEKITSSSWKSPRVGGITVNRLLESAIA